MKKFIILFIIVGMSLVFPTSCLKEYLDKAPEQGLTEEEIFTKLDNFKLFFDAVYAGRMMSVPGWSGGWSDYNIKAAFPIYWDLWDQKYSWESVTDAADMGRYMEGQAWKSGNMSETIVNKMTYDGARNPTLYSMFCCIRISNIALKNINKIQDGTDEDKNDLKGQAYFIRAFCHWTLFYIWGPMPYLTKPLGPTDQWDIPRLSKWETLTKISQDLDSAYTCFNLAGKIRRDPPSGVAGHNDYNAYQMYRPNGMAAKAYKSRVLLFRASPLNNEKGVSDWQDAAVASWEALQVAQNNGATLLTMANRKQNYFGAMVTDEHLWSYTVVIGLSGGVDSALTAAVAADALGPDRVHTLMMPSPYTGAHSLQDAKACAEALGVRYDIVGIEPAMEAFRNITLPLFGNRKEDVTEENIQSRARGVVLMAMSNKLGGMVVTTGNKSEMAVGYATLYGDMCGGYNVLKDVYKTTVFELCHWRNAHRPEGAMGPKGRVIPERVITKPPSAELREDQKDTDSLPPYPVLDAILKGLIERDLSAEELAAEGHDLATVQRVWRLLEGAEYKRRQAPPGVKITSRLISKERRYPIVNGFRG